MTPILVLLGWISFTIGLVLLVVGYIANRGAIRPGWAALAIGVILLLLGHLLPHTTTPV